MNDTITQELDPTMPTDEEIKELLYKKTQEILFQATDEILALEAEIKEAKKEQL